MNKTKALFGYTILAVALTYPLIWNMNTRLLGQGDVGLYAWNLWWVNKVYTQGNLSLFQTDYLFHPTGVSLAMRELTFYNSFLGIALQRFMSLPAAYNVLVLASFVLSGFGMYLLAKHITGADYVSFLAGFAYAFSTYRMIEVNEGHLNLTATQWIPLYMLYLMKSHKEGGLKNILYAGVFLFLINISSWQYMGMALTYTALYLLYYLALEPSGDRGSLKRVFYPTILGLLLTTPLLYPMVKEYLTRDYMRYSIGFFMGTSRIYSADLTSIALSPATMRFMKGFSGNFIPVGHTIFLFTLYFLYSEKKVAPWLSFKAHEVVSYLRRYSLFIAFWMTAYLAIMFYGLKKYYSGNTDCYLSILASISATIVVGYLVKDRKTSFWVFTALSTYVLSLGSILQFLGRTCKYPLPYLILYFIPGGSVFRTPYRFYAFFMVAASTLFALGLKTFIDKKIMGKKTTYFIVSAILLFEYGFLNYEFSTTQVPEVYKTIKEEQGDQAVLEVPIPPIEYNTKGDVGTYSLQPLSYYQTFHGKRIVGGYVERIPPEALDFIDGTSPFCEFRNVFSGDRVIECRGVGGVSSLRRLNVGFVVVHWDLVRGFPHGDNETVKRVEELVREATGGVEPFYDDRDITAYRIT
jgi:hypothetical protein